MNYVQNITDVGHLTDNADEGEDKIIAEARRRGLHPMAVVELFMHSYFDDMDAPNVLRPDISPRASAHIPEQIECVRKLLEKSCAHEVNGSVYFDVQSFRRYGQLSGRDVAAPLDFPQQQPASIRGERTPGEIGLNSLASQTGKQQPLGGYTLARTASLPCLRAVLLKRLVNKVRRPSLCARCQKLMKYPG